MALHSDTTIIGHEQPLRALAMHLEQDMVAHAYFFQGPRGIGRFQVALGFARQLLCEHHALEGDGCRSCGLFEKDSHPDLMVLEVPEGKNSISIDQTREAIQYVNVRPYLGGRKVVVIRDADDMPVEAQNSLLKTLEEPPAYVHFILLGKNQESVLATVLSRCRVLTFSRLPLGQVAEYLTGLGQDEAAQDLWLSFFGGEIGSIVKILEDSDLRQRMLSQIADYTGLLTKTPSERLNWVRSLGKLGVEDILDICSRLEILWNIALLEGLSPDTAPGEHHPIIRDFIGKAAHSTTGSIQKVLNSVVTLREDFKAGMNAQLQIENLLLSLPICLE
ncbi:hypothetical protein AUK40_03410 [Candidatus Wirthbacteria bacterium CG2_30_54_11]|uniref:DNA-directed DNA polymerase n=1 Tax=Candidatus Wirthbacteria bacterium CG2_30_54_11 TaxID=1817892 RepID=A0A1J5IKS5_9BACT|nr:MAG: hypothetical protein AUK40_03410 [Candidatus Wirthbacteria bacterium CG2_30_54_11]